MRGHGRQSLFTLHARRPWGTRRFAAIQTQYMSTRCFCVPKQISAGMPGVIAGYD